MLVAHETLLLLRINDSMVQRIDATVLYRPPLEQLRFLPEGPYPCGDGKFSWVAIQHGANEKVGSLNIFDLREKTNQSHVLPGRPGFAFSTNTDHHFVVGCERQLGIFSTLDGSWQVMADEVDSAVTGTIINDGVTWEGNLIFGAKDLKFQEAKAGLYLWRGSDRKLIQLRNDQTCSNGKAITMIGGVLSLIDIDTPTKQVVSYSIDLLRGKLGPRQVVLDLTQDAAFPDGMILTPDRHSIIISFYNPNPADHGETRQYRLSDGALERVWNTPGSPQATCPQLIELDGKVILIITTAVEHMPAERRAASPEAGSLFMAETDFLSASDAPVFTL